MKSTGRPALPHRFFLPLRQSVASLTPVVLMMACPLTKTLGSLACLFPPFASDDTATTTTDTRPGCATYFH